MRRVVRRWFSSSSSSLFPILQSQEIHSTLLHLRKIFWEWIFLYTRISNCFDLNYIYFWIREWNSMYPSPFLNARALLLPLFFLSGFYFIKIIIIVFYCRERWSGELIWFLDLLEMGEQKNEICFLIVSVFLMENNRYTKTMSSVTMPS